MISHKHKCIFIHIPKCAGTSIETALGHFDSHKGRGGQDHRSIRMIEKPVLTSAIFSDIENFAEISRRVRHRFRTVKNPLNKETVTTEQYKNYYKFSFVRNPWARAFSWYKNVMRDQIHQEGLGITHDISFKEFLLQFAGEGMLRPQTYWLKSFDGKLHLDFIGKFEQLLEDFETVKEALHVSGIDLPHKIKGKTTGLRKHYDNESIEIISNVYAEEIKLFDYSFE